MAVKRIKRKLVWEEAGVSEIIGTILMLSITVVLFTSIITFVGRMPAPQESFNVEVDCDLVPNDPDDWNTLGVKFIMLHQGGKPMDPMWIQIFIAVNDTMLTYNLEDGLQDENGDGWMGVGEYWNVNIPNTKAPVWENSTYSITIIHQEKNLLVWQETLGQGQNFYAPIIVDAWIDSDLGTADVDDPGPISYVNDFKIYAKILDPEGLDDTEQGLDKNNLWVNLSSIYGKLLPPVQLVDCVDYRDSMNDDIYVARCTAANSFYADIGYHYFDFNASDNAGLTVEWKKLFPVGMIVGENPQIVVRGDDEYGNYEYITFSDPEPVNGDSITIYATILNRGKGGAEINVTFYDGEIGESFEIGNVSMSLHAQGEREASISWEATPGGNHSIIVVAELDGSPGKNEGIYDENPDDNTNSTNISVMPKILLVDDDSHLNDLSAGDTVSYMRASLEASGFDYDFTSVGAGDGPGYDYGDYPLVKYDVVIWMTGYEESNTLTADGSASADLTNLQKFLDGDGTAGNGGSLWFISEGYWDEAFPPTSARGTFATDNLHLPSLPTEKEALPPDIFGRVGHPVTDYYSNNSMNMVERVPGTSAAWSWNPVTILDADSIALNNSDNSKAYTLTYDSDEEPTDMTEDSRILVQTWDFSRIEDTATQAQYTYKAIRWLGNVTMKRLNDIAISEQTIEPATVFYKQNVQIKFIVRNNGFHEYDLSSDLYYLLRITDVAGEDVIMPEYMQIDFLGSGANNTREIEYSWIPENIGYHRIVIKVDPYNHIAESNEQNNEISSFLASGELFVQYRVLVVDDDDSSNNGGVRINETLEVETAMEYLNATGLYQYENYTVNAGSDGPAYNPGLNGAGLSEYNAVIWVGGEAIDPFTAWDIVNLTDYMDLGGNLWFIGNGLWTAGDTDVSDGFERDYLKIANVTGDQNMASTLWGLEDDYVSHGMEYSSSGDPDADELSPHTGGVGYTYSNDAKTRFNSVRYEGAPISNSSRSYRVATTTWLLSSLDSNYSKAEFTFMMLRWFDKPENRIETKISNVDIWLSDEHPQLGSGYVIQATVHNTGGSIGNVLVRFIDGDTQIGSDSISVSAGETTTAEMIWVPLFAGPRTISILVDPISEVDEIFEWSNNNATKDIYVYFFWDNMEGGTSKWAHSSTILLINGEEPLEYFYGTNLDTNIITDWDSGLSTGLTNSMDPGFYHTLDTAYWLQEPAGGGGTTTKVPVDIVMTLDNSGSMYGDDDGNGNRDYIDLRDAATNFVDGLEEADRCALYAFTWGNNNDPDFIQNFVQMNQDMGGGVTGREYTKDNIINGVLWPTSDWSSFTPIWDTIHEAIDTAYYDSNPANYPVVVAMTDGSDTTSTRNGPDSPYADQTADPDFDDLDATDDWNSDEVCEAPIVVFTIGMAVSGGEFGVTGQKLNETAMSSNPAGKFYYGSTAGVLDNIYTEISEEIYIQLEGENQTRSGGAVPVTLATTIFSETFPNADNPWDGSADTAQDEPGWLVAQGNGDTDDVRVSNVDVASGTQPPSGGNHLTFNDCDQGAAPPNAYDWAWVPIDLSAYSNCVLTYYWQDDDCDPSEGGRVDYSTDAVNGNSGTWTNIYTHINQDENDWYMETFNIPDVDAVATFSLRFSARCSSTQENFMFDDITIITNNPPNTPEFVSHGGDIIPSGPTIGDDTPVLDWNDFSDPDVGDTQASYQVIVYLDSDDSVVWDSGIVASTASVATCGVLPNDVYYWTAIVSDGTAWSAPGGGKNTWYFTVNTAVNQPPNVPHTPSPADGEGGVSTSSVLSWICSDPDGDPLTYDVYLDTSNPPTTLIANDVGTPSISPALAESTIYYWNVTASDGSLFTDGPVWIFATTGASGDLGLSPEGPNSNKTAVTETFNLENLTSAKLSFWHKYNMMPGANGGFLQVGYKGDATDGDPTDWDWKYVIPANAYTGNLRASVVVNDSFDSRIFWCWNGISSRGTFDWEYVSVNLLSHVPTGYRDEVKVKFNYTQYGGGTGYGWYFDDVRVEVSRPNYFNPDSNSQDIWNLTTAQAHSGNYSWANYDPDDPDMLKAGIDNYLMTTPIDLTNAKTAYLSAYLKFNINEDSGAPPDGFRVEVSTDNGVTWTSINLGVRSSWGVSGTGSDADDGNVSDGKTYTGLCDSGDEIADDYWVEMNTLSRVNIDLSSFSGNAIHVRFRMATCGHAAYEHNNNHNQVDPGFGGFYVDDVIVYGETIMT